MPTIVQDAPKTTLDDLKPSPPKRAPWHSKPRVTSEPQLSLPKMDTAYTAWQRQPTPGNMSRVISQLEPTIQKAIKTFATAPGPLVHGRARAMAVRAVESYAPTRGAKLETHVMNQLQGLRRYSLSATSALRQSERHKRDYMALREAETEFYDETGREPTDIELADKLGISAKKIALIRKYGTQEIGTSLAEGTTGDEGSEGGVGIYEVDPEEIWLDYVYHDLSPVDQKIMDWKLGRNGQPVLPNNEIAKRLRITPPAVTQRSARIMQKLEEGMSIAEQTRGR